MATWAPILFLIISTFASICLAGEGCKKYDVEPVEASFIKGSKQPGAGWYILFKEEMKFTDASGIAQDMSKAKKEKPADFKGKKNFCWKGETKAFGKIESKCQYENFQEQFCTLYKDEDSVGTKALTDHIFARVTIIASDNKSYYISVTCLNEGSHYSFAVMSPKESVDAATKAKIEAQLKKAGFALKGKDANNLEVSNRMKTSECAGFERDTKKSPLDPPKLDGGAPKPKLPAGEGGIGGV